MNKSNLEIYQNPAYPYIFRKSVAAGTSGIIEMELTGHGYITAVNIIFATGENGTLHLRPYVQHPGELNVELLKYPEDGDQFISGDDCKYQLPCYQEVENHSRLLVAYENIGAGVSEIMVDVLVQYEAYYEPHNVIG